jgi:hypothetical protein
MNREEQDHHDGGHFGRNPVSRDGGAHNSTMTQDPEEAGKFPEKLRKE